jgi:hypothetical protein
MTHETTHVCSTFVACGAASSGSRAPLLGCLHIAALPDLAGQWARATSRPDCPELGLCGTERAECHSCLPCPRINLCAGPVAPPPTHAVSSRCAEARTAAGAVTRKPPDLWQAPQPLDPPLGRGGLLGAWPHPLSRQHREHPPSPQAPGGELAASQTLDHQPRSPIRAKNKGIRRERMFCSQGTV